MNEEITEHIAHDRGYNKGYEAGRKRAFELIGELAEFYENEVGIDEDASDEEKRLHENSRRNQVNACRMLNTSFAKIHSEKKIYLGNYEYNKRKI